MLTSYFKSSRTMARYRSGLAGPYLDDFSRWLESRGYVRTRIRHHIRYVAHFGDWAREEGLTIKKCDQKSLNKLRSQLAKQNSLRDRQGNHNPLYQSARVFVTFLEATGLVVALPIKAKTPELLREFCEWMRVQRGTLDTTLTNYRLCIISMLHSMGSEPKSYTAKKLREFLVRHTAHSRPAKSKNMATALRMFLRFLIAQGDCAAGLDHAIPTVAHWRLSSIPKYLPADDVERLIDSCDQNLSLGARDRAMLLLIARLGLRASEVSKLKISDLDWREGKLIVSGKNRTETKLPLPQGVGDAILHYLKHGRAQIASHYVFITTTAPLVPITSKSVSRAVFRALRRTGISAPMKGSHLLRHSLATKMLRDGAALASVGALLRHTSMQTTQVYAKVDFASLKEVAMPWPEVQSC